MLKTFHDPNSEKHPIIPIGWLNSKDNLYTFYQKLFYTGRIACDYDSFECHFIGQVEEYIIWYGTDGELVHLLSGLIDIHLVPFHPNYIVLLCNHFCRRNGSLFNRVSLRVLKSRTPNMFISNFIKDLEVAVQKDKPS